MSVHWKLASLALSLVLGITAASAESPPEWRTDDETVGQEYQRDPSSVVHADGSRTTVWVDFRTGYPGLYVRSFDAQGNSLGAGRPFTTGLGLFATELTPFVVETPALADLPGQGTMAVWRETRGGRDRIVAGVLRDDALVAGPVWVHEEARPEVRSDPQVAVSGDRALVVWTEGSGGRSNVYGQILTFDLSPLGANFPLHPEAAGIQAHPRAAASALGWTTTWSTTIGERAEVFLRAVPSDGVPRGSLVRVEQTEEYNQREPAILSLPDGCFVCWTHERNGNFDLRGSQRAANLAAVDAPFFIVDPGATDVPRSPELLPDGPDKVLALWTAGSGQRPRHHARAVSLPSTPLGSFVVIEDPEDPEGQILIPRGFSVAGTGPENLRAFWSDTRDGWELAYEMEIDASGNARSPAAPIEIQDGSASQVFPACAFFPDGGAFVAWEDFRSGGLAIHGVPLDASGMPNAPALRLSEVGGGSIAPPSKSLRDLVRMRPAMTTTSDGRAVVAWPNALISGRTRIYMQIYDQSGALIGNNILLPPLVFADGQNSPALASNPDGTFTIVWREFDRAGDIYARRYLSDGTPEGSDPVDVMDAFYADAGQSNPSVASAGTGEVIVVWLDERNGNTDVFAQRIGPTGIKIQSNVQVSGVEDAPIPQLNAVVAAAPDRYVVVWDDNPLGEGAVTGLLVLLPTAKQGEAAREEMIPFSIGTGSPGFKFPRVSMQSDGRFVVSFWDTVSDSARVMAQRFAADARRIGEPYSVLSIGGRTAALPGDVDATPNEILYAYADSRDNRGWDVRVRQVTWSFNGELTAVALSHWSIEERPEALLVRWSVPLSRAGSSYVLWRASSDGSDPGTRPPVDALRVTPEPIGPSLPGGTDYAVSDSEAPAGPAVVYWIEDEAGEFAGPWVARRAGKPALSLAAQQNPFFDRAPLAWSAPAGQEVELSLHDVQGRMVRRAKDGEMAGGSGVWVWDGRDAAGRELPAGVYWAHLATPRGEKSVKLVHLRGSGAASN